ALPPTTTTVAGSAITSGLLYPGSSGEVKITVNNPNTYPVTLTSVTPNGAPTASGGTGTCSTTGVTLTGGSSGTTIPADGSVTLTLKDAASMSSASDTGCQNATFTIPVAVRSRAHEAPGPGPARGRAAARRRRRGHGRVAHTSTGSAAAKAGSIGTPTGVTIGTPTCTGSGSSIPVSWAVVEGAAQYTIESSPLGLFLAPQSQTVSTASAPHSAGGTGSIHVRVRATAGKWTSATSTVVSRRISC
ncbi:MAG TPA: hypothetical protein VK935_06570, partial [Actinomycetospora sp.]|nr:hypothetical protein [Actinomycetospora sp.]